MRSDSAVRSDFDVAVVGAGPAGVAAACRAAESGARVVLVDDGLRPGGQIWRHRPSNVPPAARTWLDRLARSGATILSLATVFDAVRHDDHWLLPIEDAQPLAARRIVIATGARELMLPFPGWTLPNVFSAGGLQALVKSGFDVAGKTVVVAGSGPLLLPVAATLARAGARLAVVAEAAPLGSLVRFSSALAGSPAKLVDAVKYRLAFRGARYRTGTWVIEAAGTDRVESVTLSDGRRIACDLAAVSYGLVPNADLAELLGCDTDRDGVRVDDCQRTSIDGVFAAGEPCGVAGVDVALAEGEIAGLAAAADGDVEVPPALVLARAGGRRIARAMADAFRPRDELRQLARPDTIVCRCEDVRHARFDPAWTARQAKLATRAGMGACQGRVCGPALAELFGYSAQSVRTPLKPTSLGALSSLEDDAWSGTEYSPR
ncbi:MAG TPA: FAD/NAD(P)-binding oxidoreductase [Blastocatellia bacterium]|nr:FAD/NAD(P)-binding oxidoreductase [Blastocatellia bacterium]